MGDFEKDMKKLEEIAGVLQSGEQGIEKSMELYTEGIKLADSLIKKLERLRSKIEIIEKEVEDGE